MSFYISTMIKPLVRVEVSILVVAIYATVVQITGLVFMYPREGMTS